MRSSYLAACFIVCCTGFPVVTFACGGGVGWAKPQEGMAQLSFADAVATAKKDFDVEIKKADMQARCGSTVDYTVVDTASGKMLATLPIPSADEKSDDGRTLSVRVQQLFKTPRAQLLALKQARDFFYEDMRGLEEELGVGAYVPNAFSFEDRTENNGQTYLIYVYLQEFCAASGAKQSPYLVYQGFPIQTIEYIPGRSDYAPETIYQSGDFKKAVVNHEELMNEIQSRVQSNAQYCQDDQYGKKQHWMVVSQRLAGSKSDLLRSSVEVFQDSIQNPTAAYMINENRIAVESSAGSRLFAGTVTEMVAIQAALTRKGIVTDRKSRLNWEGQIAVRVARDRNRPLPLSLQD